MSDYPWPTMDLIRSQPTTAIGMGLLAWMSERADCYREGECVHDHINGACDYADGAL